MLNFHWQVRHVSVRRLLVFKEDTDEENIDVSICGGISLVLYLPEILPPVQPDSRADSQPAGAQHSSIFQTFGEKRLNTGQ